jgi:hypothetical protein
MIRSILASASMILAFTATAQANKYECPVATYDTCRLLDGCSRTTATNGIHYIFDTQAKTLTFCKSANKKDCTEYKALVSAENSEITAAVVSQERHLLWLNKPSNEFTGSWIDADHKVYNFHGQCVAR